ncbi:hypothetical protein L7F22_012250 [Adiantum nelumboides]|nr:hypothetical protein [Adiantum nelumboides]
MPSWTSPTHIAGKHLDFSSVLDMQGGIPNPLPGPSSSYASTNHQNSSPGLGTEVPKANDLVSEPLDNATPPQVQKDNLNCNNDGALVIELKELHAWYQQLNERVVIALCHGARPSADTLKQWIAQQWGRRGINPSHVQYLPNNYYLFFFDNPNEALQVIGQGQWIIRNTPLSVFKWYVGFNSRGDKPSKIPVWIDFPDLPVEFYPWLNSWDLRLELCWVKRQEEGSIPNGTLNSWWKLIPSRSLDRKFSLKILLADCYAPKGLFTGTFLMLAFTA